MATGIRGDRNVVEDILTSAREQFLSKGYEKASLRSICAGAGVTTGAFYFSFRNKEALFDALIRPTLDRIDEALAFLEEHLMHPDDVLFDEAKFNDFLFRFLVENRDGICLLIGRAEGVQYDEFSTKVRGSIQKLMTFYADRKAGVTLDPQVVRILTNLYSNSIADLLSEDRDLDEMLRVADLLRTCMEQGFYAMLEQQKGEG